VVARVANKEYKTLVNSKSSDEAFLSNVEIKREHEGFKKVALKHFEEHRIMRDAESDNEDGILDQLKRVYYDLLLLVTDVILNLF